MLNEKAFANAATVITAVYYVACILLSIVAPDLVRLVGNSWVHSISLELIKNKSGISLTDAFLGLISISAATWVTAYATIWLYNKLVKK